MSKTKFQLRETLVAADVKTTSRMSKKELQVLYDDLPESSKNPKDEGLQVSFAFPVFVFLFLFTLAVGSTTALLLTF